MITLWLHHLDSNRARWVLHKNATCCFEQILEAAPYKTAALQPLISNLTNQAAGEVRTNS